MKYINVAIWGLSIIFYSGAITFSFMRGKSSGRRGGHKGRSREPRERRKRSRSEAREEKMLTRDQTYAQGRAIAMHTTVHYEDRYLSNEPKAEPHPIRDDLFDLIVKSDYDDMMKTNAIAVMPRVKQLMLMQSIVGHAQSGHSRFRNIAYYPNATIDDVYLALEKDPVVIRRQRQDIIDGIYWYVDQALRDPYHKRLKSLWNKNGAPLAGATMFRDYELDVRKGDVVKVLRGLYLASTMDNYVDWRMRVQNRFGIIMGGGRNFALDLHEVTRWGESLQSLATEPHDDEFIRTHIGLGSIIDQDAVEPGPNIVNGYVRIAKGKGVSDDGALITAGVKYGGMPTFFGVFLGDAIDTWDKSTPEIKRFGQDEAIGTYIWSEAADIGIDLGLTESMVEEFIYLAAIDPERPTQYPDCSQRRFLLQSDIRGKKEEYYAMRLHNEFVEAVKTKKPVHLPSRQLGFASVPSEHFYETWLKRFNDAHDSGVILSPRSIPEPKSIYSRG